MDRLILIYRNIYLLNQPIQILFISKEKNEKMISLFTRFFSIFVMESDRSKRSSPFFQEQLIPRSFFSFSHLAKSRASLLSF